eukprot:878935_1
MGCCFSSSSGGPDKEIDEIALPEVFPYRVGGVNLDHSYSDRPWYKRFDLICPIIVILLFVLLVSWALISSKTSFPGSKLPEIASDTDQAINSKYQDFFVDGYSRESLGTSLRTRLEATLPEMVGLSTALISKYADRRWSYDFVAKLLEDNIKLVIFDMGGTATPTRTRGRIRTKDPNGVYGSAELKAFSASATQDFKEIVPILLKDGFSVGIATYSDKIFMSHEKKEDRKMVLAGEALVDEFLEGSFPGEDNNSNLRESIGVIARHSPDHYRDESRHNKNPHIEDLCDRFGLETRQAVLFDDAIDNVNAAK